MTHTWEDWCEPHVSPILSVVHSIDEFVNRSHVVLYTWQVVYVVGIRGDVWKKTNRCTIKLKERVGWVRS